VVAKNPFVPEM